MRVRCPFCLVAGKAPPSLTQPEIVSSPFLASRMSTFVTGRRRGQPRTHDDARFPPFQLEMPDPAPCLQLVHSPCFC
ncbi:hypothetical protein BJY59DRAFT_706099 [Rhodotorula toruloides]